MVSTLKAFVKLNRNQTLFRNFKDEEIEEIIELQRNAEDNMILFAISILLARKKEIEYYKKKLSIEELKNIKEYPIYKLLDKQ